MNCAGMRSSSASLSNRCDTPKSVPSFAAQVCTEHYSALMRKTKHTPLLLASLLMASVTFAQTKDEQRADPAPADVISAARSRYIQTAGISPDADNRVVAQFQRGAPPRPFPVQHGYTRGSYQTPWVDHGSAGHILIGAAIGFGVGAALGAKQSAQNGTPVSGGIVLGGALFGLLGGCVGRAVGDLQGLHYWSAHSRRVYRPSWPEDDVESKNDSHSKAMENAREPSEAAKPAAPGTLSASLRISQP
jgi:hypothetical protein